jgi:hypothetical protein
MTRFSIRQAAASVAMLTLSACGGGGGNGGGGDTLPEINCEAISGGTAQAIAVENCSACGVSNAGAAIDNDLDTFAVLHMRAEATGTIGLRAVAQDGIVYPAGTPAAVVYGLSRNNGGSFNTAETISTYLDGVLQNTGTVSIAGVDGGDRPLGRRATGTTKDFDAIEYTYAQTGGTTEVEIHVHEFCTSVN